MELMMGVASAVAIVCSLVRLAQQENLTRTVNTTICQIGQPISQDGSWRMVSPILPSSRYDDDVRKNQAAQALGKLGGEARAKALTRSELSKIGKKGAAARKRKLTAAQRSEIARKAVQARIAKYGQRAATGKK